MKIKNGEFLFGDCINILKEMDADSIDLTVSDIPYGISYEEWDVLHNNKNSALLGSSPAQEKAGSIFKKRGKPLNGWSEDDRKLSQEYENWCDEWSSPLFKIMKPASSVFIFAGRRLSHRCINSFEKSGFILKDQLAWIRNSAPFRAQRVSAVFDRRKDTESSAKWEGWRLGNLRPEFEPILWFTKPYKIGSTITDNILNNNLGGFNPKNGNSNILNADRVSEKFHPTQKPINTISDLIELVSVEGQVVLDPFAGSGTTAVAAERLNRRWICIEKEEEYYNKAIDRIKNEE